MTKDDVLALLHKGIVKAGGLRAWARDNDLSAAYVSDVLAERRTLGPSILSALGVEIASSTTTYRRQK